MQHTPQQKAQKAKNTIV
jgi:hypothetical protein